jgi:chromosome segregation ATPase
MAKKWNFDANNAEAAGRVLKKMEGLLAKTKEELSSGRKPLDAAVAEAASEVSVVQAERSGLSRTEAQTKQDIKSMEREIEAKRALGGSKAALEQQLEKARHELAGAHASVGDMNAYAASVEELQKSKNETEKQLSGLSEQMVTASQIESLADRLKATRQQVAAQEEELHTLQTRYKPLFLRLLKEEELPSSGLVQAVSAALAQKRKEVASGQKQLEELRAARMTTSSRMESLRHEQSGVDKTVWATRAQLALLPGLGEGGSVAEKLALVEATLEEDGARVAELTAEQELYSKFVQHAAAKAECLVCERGFDTTSEAQQFEGKLRKKLKVANESLGPAKKERDESEQVVSVLRPAVPIQVLFLFFLRKG